MSSMSFLPRLHMRDLIFIGAFVAGLEPRYPSDARGFENVPEFVQVTDQPTEPDVIELGICPTVPAKHAVFVGDPWQSTRSDFWSVPSVK